MATNPDAFLDEGSTRTGRWLGERRLRVALWIAVVEGIVVAVSPAVSRWTVIALAVVTLALYMLVFRNIRMAALRQISWIAAASQLLALLVVVLAFFLTWLAILAIVAFAALALVYLILDRR
jgi:hypothetical protein